MADPESDASVSDDVLEAVTEAMIALHARYHGRAPVSARTRMMGDGMLAVMLGDPYTDADITAAYEATKDKTELDALVAYLQGLGMPAKGPP